MDLGQRSASADTNDGTQFVSSSVPERVLGGGEGQVKQDAGVGERVLGREAEEEEEVFTGRKFPRMRLVLRRTRMCLRRGLSL